LFRIFILENVLHVKKIHEKRIHTKKNVCLLKAEKLLIEKLTLIIGGFYQFSETTWQELKVSCLIKYLKEGKILCKFLFLQCTQGFRAIVCLCHIIACILHADPQHFPALRLHYNCSFHGTTNRARKERKMLNWNFLAHFGADHFGDYFPSISTHLILD
jgi:hypothetical protein